MARRLLANILLANGDAHLKNWTVYYPDGINARLAPAYDIVTTLPYVRGENSIALNLAGEKLWYAFSMATFEKWAQQIGVPWPAVRVHLLDAIGKARELWPVLLAELPMHVAHKVILARHWAALSADFKIG
jgi:serine/threonine-protein kinase HipA